MKLGPLTRRALSDAGIDEARLAGIDEGEYQWKVALAPATGRSADEESALRVAREARVRKDFAICISRSGEPVYDTVIASALGQRLAGTRRYEEALSARGGAESALFAQGTMDDWTEVTCAGSWDALAYEFRRAAEAVAASHTTTSPAPTLALLYLCRHHLELALKAVIMSGDRLMKRGTNPPIQHSLLPLWGRAQQHLRRTWIQGWNEGDATTAQAIIAEFDRIDRTSMATRYPVDTSNVAFERPAPLLNFSVSAFMEAFGTAADFLSTGMLWIEVALSSGADAGSAG